MRVPLHSDAGRFHPFGHPGQVAVCLTGGGDMVIAVHRMRRAPLDDVQQHNRRPRGGRQSLDERQYRLGQPRAIQGNEDSMIDALTPYSAPPSVV